MGTHGHPRFSPRSVVWVLAGVITSGTHSAKDPYLECEVLADNGGPSVHVQVIDTEIAVWVFRRYVEAVRPK